MRKSSKGSKAAVKAEQPPAAEGVDEVKVKAVNEMMERIKHGVVLRPVKCQDNKRTAVKQPPVTEEKQQESAMEELKGILDTVKRSPSRGSQDSGSSPQGKKDSELELILRRRRNKAGESGDEHEGQLSHVSSCDSLSGRRISTDSSRDTEVSGGLCVPSDPPGPTVSPERRGSGPGPIVPRRKSSDSGTKRLSCSSVSGRDTAQSPVTNGAAHSGAEEEPHSSEACVRSNGVSDTEVTVNSDINITVSDC